MALVTTFATTPLTLALFPPWYQRKLAAWKRGEIDWDGTPLRPEHSADDDSSDRQKAHTTEIKKLLVSLRLESLPSIFTFVALLGGEKPDTPVTKTHPSKGGKDDDTTVAPALQKRPLEVHGLRMLELTERLSSVMKDSEVEEWSTRDPVLNAFHTFGQLNNVAVSGQVELVPEGSYSEILHQSASDRKSDMILLPWSERGSLSEAVTPDMSESNPNAFSNGTYNNFMTNFLDSTACTAAILVNNGFGAAPRDEAKGLRRVATNLSLRSIRSVTATAPLVNRSHHIFFPFIGGLDDHVALRFVLRLAKNPNVTATIAHMKGENSHSEITTETSKTTDNERVVTTASQEILTTQDQGFFTSMADSLSGDLESRVLFTTIDSHNLITDSVEQARVEVNAGKNAGDLVVVGRGHGRRGAAAGGSGGTYSDVSVQQCLGLLAEAMIGGNVKASVLVIQAGVKAGQE